MPERPPRLPVALPLLVLVALIALARLHTYHEPLELDLTTYAVVGHEFLQGRHLYSDLWDHKPPAVHVTYALAETLAGYGPRAIYLVNVAAAVATLLGIFAAGAAVGPAVGLAAAAFWAIACGHLGLQANQPNVEVFLNAFSAWGLACLLRVRAPRVTSGWLLAAATALAVASLYKPNAVFIAAALAAGHVLRPPEGVLRRTAIRQAAAIGLAIVLAWGGLAGYFAVTGRFGDFSDAVFTYNRAYSGSAVWNLARGLKPGRLFPAVLYPLLPLAVPALLGALGAARGAASGRPIGRPAALVLAYAAGVYPSIATPGHFWPHYYQLWLPPLALGAAIALGALRPSRFRVVAATVAVALAAVQVPSYLLDADEWSRRKYGEIYLQSRDAARAIDRLLAPDETFYHWGSQTGLYYESRRRPPSGVFYALPLLEGPLRDRLVRRVVAVLERDPPELVMVHDRTPAEPAHPVVKWYEERYRPIGRRGSFQLQARTGGRLDAAAASTGMLEPP